MNTNAYTEMAKNIETLLMAALTLYAGMMLAIGANYLATGFSAIHCAIKGPPKDKTPWIIVMVAFPLIGWVSYWIWADRSQYDDLKTYRQTPAPQKTDESKKVADAVNADIEEMLKKRREERKS